MSDMYILEDRKPVPCSDVLRWAQSQADPGRVVKQEEIGNHRVSTMFLGIDHSFGGGEPLLFETMIFPECDYQTRCSTWEQAEQMHRAAVESLTREAK